eukprot:8883717-Pyramimonas_sp.AAC.1
MPRWAVGLRLARSSGGCRIQAVVKRAGSPIALPNSVLRTFCDYHEMFLEHFWRSLSCFNTSGFWSYNIVLFFEHVWVLRAFRGRTIGMPGRSVPAQSWRLQGTIILRGARSTARKVSTRKRQTKNT